ncbi:hypothetical protein SAMN02745121_08148 [Nannocystis exedens]|uniref:Uncharacterized protein n=1 Tax=Nannocystis exedens TaxID=54 RepID=A0A1I2HQZ3_9BACT|nr:hypothetical protein [Nannocystis exedens]PCC69396.1 hypothetical protein NAEX_02418 [Nannocystis exedens]SFF32269.1 hypothetical protein SAMN02745121_08148 [Nannocystis exedens]
MSGATDLDGCIERILENLDGVARTRIADEHRRWFAAAMLRNLYHLGLACAREPARRREASTRLAPVWRHFADEGMFELQWFAGRQASSALREAEGWPGPCRGRSALAFFIELADAALEFESLMVDLAALDEDLRELADREGYLRDEEIDAGVPPTHWWWWAPRGRGGAT